MKYSIIDNKLMIDIDSLFYKSVQDLMDDLIPSRKIQHLLITNGWIQMDSIKVKRETILDGDKLSIDLYPETYSYLKREEDEVDIVYEDELLVIVNKKAGELVHSDGGSENSVKDKLESHYSRKNNCTYHPLHRLDRETGGLLLFSKSIIFQPLFDKYMEEKKIQRYYIALCMGKCDKGVKMTIDSPLGKDRHNAKKMVVYAKGQPAVTKVESLGYKNGITAFKCNLLTGRTHQIRVHLSSKGYPIINDDLYGKAARETKQMGLFANMVKFFHPLKEENITVSCDLPDELKKLMPR